MWAASYGWRSARQPLQLLAEVALKGLRAQGVTAHLFHQLSGVHAAAQRVDPLLQPLAKIAITAGLQ